MAQATRESKPPYPYFKDPMVADATDEVQDGLVLALLTTQRDRAEIDEQIATIVAALAAKRGVSVAAD